MAGTNIKRFLSVVHSIARSFGGWHGTAQQKHSRYPENGVVFQTQVSLDGGVVGLTSHWIKQFNGPTSDILAELKAVTEKSDAQCLVKVHESIHCRQRYQGFTFRFQATSKNLTRRKHLLEITVEHPIVEDSASEIFMRVQNDQFPFSSSAEDQGAIKRECLLKLNKSGLRGLLESSITFLKTLTPHIDHTGKSTPLWESAELKKVS
jgi:hypothetical protein